MRIIHEALTFDDVLLEPAYSDFLPREVQLKTQLTRTLTLNIPLVSSAMDTVTEAALAIALAQQGGIGVIHKNLSIERQAEEVDKVKRSESGIMLISALPVWPIRILAHDWRTWSARRPDRQYVIRTGNCDVEYGHYRAPEIDGRFCRGLTGTRIDQFHIQRQGHRHTNETVFNKVREIDRAVAVCTEVVGIHWAEERIVSILVVLKFRLQRFVASPR